MTRQKDYREKSERRSVFLKFYMFHLKYRAHPGAVYYVIPHLRDVYGWTEEELLWFAFLNGNTQHPLTSLLLHRQSPTPKQIPKLLEYFQKNAKRLEFDTDRRHQKYQLPLAAEGFSALLRGRTITQYWKDACVEGFDGVWKASRAIPTFGRLSAFSFSEYLRICGVPFQCDRLFLEDITGSKSHRNGLCKVLGLDEYDWHKSNPSFNGKYSKELLTKLEAEAAKLLSEAREMAKGKDYEQDVGYFTLESALCTYKSWHRKNRRYPNVYNDMFYLRIKKSQRLWPQEDFSEFWNARKKALPEYLRLEDSPYDPGLTAIKQNHYRLTGQVIMMNRDYPEFQNDFNDAVNSKALKRRTA